MGGKRITLWAVIAATSVIFESPTRAYAHAFAERYTLPLPLWLYISSAGVVVVLTFAITALFFRRKEALASYPRINLLRWRIGRLLAHPTILSSCKIISVGIFILVILAGFLGNQNSLRNIGPTMVWVIWWVGLAYVSALIGNLWALINPWKVIFGWAEALHGRLRPGRELSHRIPYPQSLGVWPAIILFIAFAWTELIWPGAEVPINMSRAAVGYSMVIWLGMLVFGREEWLRKGEAFSLFAALLARFSPTEVRVLNPEVCAGCSSLECREHGDGCVDCYECYGKAEERDREWNLRPFAVGLLTRDPVSPSMMIFVLLTLSTVTFDGFLETPAWAGILGSMYKLQAMGPHVVAGIYTSALVVFPVLFYGAYMIFSHLMAIAVGSATPVMKFTGEAHSVSEIARLFILSLVPIAIAYHLAHYLAFLIVAGQLVIPLASDPFGFGWDLLGTAGYQADLGLVGVTFAWYTAVIAIVVGHVIAVYLAHIMALRSFKDGRLAIRSQYPMLILMVGYTMISLWILAQPIVTPMG